jgi:PadR family transcriptional regulator PadR
MYGYELIRAIRIRTKGAIHLGEGVVYPTLHALETAGALKSKRKPVNGRDRIYYSITNDGSRKLARITSSWTGVTNAILALLKGAKCDSAT